MMHGQSSKRDLPLTIAICYARHVEKAPDKCPWREPFRLPLPGFCGQGQSLCRQFVASDDGPSRAHAPDHHQIELGEIRVRDPAALIQLQAVPEKKQSVGFQHLDQVVHPIFGCL